MAYINVVVPTIREAQIVDFLKAWEPVAKASIHSVEFIIIEDNPKPTFKLPKLSVPVKHYSWKDIDAELGKDAWIIPRRSDCIRSYGFIKSFQDNLFGMTVTLDDDVRPTGSDRFGNFFDTYAEEHAKKRALSSYVDTSKLIMAPDIADTPHMRGFPFRQRLETQDVDVVYCMWDNVPDFDGITQLSAEHTENYCSTSETLVAPKHLGVTGCIMNVGFSNLDMVPKYQLLMGKDAPFDRWGDIWSGLFNKRINDIVGDATIFSGKVSVVHTRASNVQTNIIKEASGYTVNEELWDKLLQFQPSKKGLNKQQLYLELSMFVEETNLFNNAEYSTKISKAMQLWIKYVGRDAWKLS